MQKKQKSHKPYTGKIKRRKMSPQTLKSISAKHRRRSGSAGSRSNSGQPNHYSIKEILPSVSQNWPTLEVHSNREILQIPNTDMMTKAIQIAGRYVADELIGIDQRMQTLAMDPGRTMTFIGLDKIVIKEDDRNGRSLTFYYYDENRNHWFVSTKPGVGPRIENREHAIANAAATVANLIFEDSKVNPENHLRERTVLIDKASIIVTLQDHIRMYEMEAEQSGKSMRDYANSVLQDLSDQLGGVISTETIATIDPKIGQKAYIGACLAISLGEKKWPFEENSAVD